MKQLNDADYNMTTCVNPNSKEFKQLSAAIEEKNMYIPEGILKALCSTYQNINNTDELPSVDYIVSLSKKDTSANGGINKLFQDHLLGCILEINKSANKEFMLPQNLVKQYVDAFSFIPYIQNGIKEFGSSSKFTEQIVSDIKDMHASMRAPLKSTILGRVISAIRRIISPRKIGGYGELIAYSILTGKDLSLVKLGYRIRLISDGAGRYASNSVIDAARISSEYFGKQILSNSEFSKISGDLLGYINGEKPDGYSINQLIVDNKIAVDDNGVLILDVNNNGPRKIAALSSIIAGRFGVELPDIIRVNDGDNSISLNEELFYLLNSNSVSSDIDAVRKSISDIQKYNEFAQNTIQNINATVNTLENKGGSVFNKQLSDLKLMAIKLDCDNIEKGIADSISNMSDIMLNMMDYVEQNINIVNSTDIDPRHKLNELNDFFMQFMSFSRGLISDYNNYVNGNQMFAYRSGMSSESLDSMTNTFDNVMSVYNKIDSGFKYIRKGLLSKILKEEAVKNNFSDEQTHTLLSSLDFFFNDVSAYARLRGNVDNMSNMIAQVAGNEFANRVSNAKALANESVVELNKKFVAMVKNSSIKEDDLYERDFNNNYTGNFISEYNRGEYERQLREFQEKTIKDLNEKYEHDITWATITSIDDMDQRQRREFKRAVTKWKFHGEDGKGPKARMKFTEEYYNTYDEMSDNNLIKLDKINKGIAAIKSKYIDSSGRFDNRQMTSDDYDAIENYNITKRSMGSVYNMDGTIKTGTDLEDAINYSETKKKLSEFNPTEYDIEKYLSDEKWVKENRSAEEYEAWVSKNKIEANSDTLYEKLKNVKSERKYSLEMAAIAFKRKNLIRIGKNSSGIIQNVSVLDEIRKLDEAYSNIGSDHEERWMRDLASSILRELPQSSISELNESVKERNSGNGTEEFKTIAEVVENKELKDIKDNINNQISELRGKLRYATINKLTDDISDLNNRIKLLESKLRSFYYFVQYGDEVVSKPLSVYSSIRALKDEDRKFIYSSSYLKNDDSDMEEYTVMGDLPSDEFKNSKFDSIKNDEHANNFYEELISTNKKLLKQRSGNARLYDPYKSPMIRKTWRDVTSSGLARSFKDVFVENEQEENQLDTFKKSTNRIKDQSGNKIKYMQMWYRRKLKDMNMMSTNTCNNMYQLSKKIYEYDEIMKSYGLIMGLRGAQADAKALGLDEMNNTDSSKSGISTSGNSAATDADIAKLLKSRKSSVKASNKSFIGSNTDKLFEDFLDKFLYGINDIKQREGSSAFLAKAMKNISTFTSWTLIRTKIVPFITNRIQSGEAMAEIAAGDSDSSFDSIIRASKYIAMDKMSYMADNNRFIKKSLLTGILSEYGFHDLSFYSRNAKHTVKNEAKGLVFGLHSTILGGYDSLVENSFRSTQALSVLADYRFLKDADGKYSMVTKGRYDVTRASDKSIPSWSSLPCILDAYEMKDGLFGPRPEFSDVINENRGFIAKRAQKKVSMFDSAETHFNRGKLYSDRFLSALVVMKTWMQIIFDRTWRGTFVGPMYSFADRKVQMGFVAYAVNNLLAKANLIESTDSYIDRMFTKEEAAYQKKQLKRSSKGNGLVFMSLIMTYWAASTALYSYGIVNPDDGEDEDWWSKIFKLLTYKLLNEKSFPFLPSQIMQSANKTTNNTFVLEELYNICAAAASGDTYANGPYKDASRFKVEMLKNAPYADVFLTGDDRSGSMRYQLSGVNMLVQLSTSMLFGGSDRLKSLRDAKRDEINILQSSAGVYPGDISNKPANMLKNEKAADLDNLSGSILKKMAGYTTFDDLKKNYENGGSMFHENNPYLNGKDKWKTAYSNYIITEVNNTLGNKFFKENEVAKYMVKKELLQVETYRKYSHDVGFRNKLAEDGLDSKISQAKEQMKRLSLNDADYQKNLQVAEKVAKFYRDRIIDRAVNTLRTGGTEKDDNVKSSRPTYRLNSETSNSIYNTNDNIDDIKSRLAQ